MTIDEQVENLKELGLVINDEGEVKEFLNDVSYFRLIKAYSICQKYMCALWKLSLIHI